jgi:DNA recombination protein RmuC
LWRRNVTLRAQLEGERRLAKSQDALEQKFSYISNEILLRNHEFFVNLAKEKFETIVSLERAEQNKKQNEFLSVVKPIQEALVGFTEKIELVEKERIGAYSDLRRQVQHLLEAQQTLQKETNSLTNVLSKPQTGGSWGEMQLQRVVELSGMSNYCDFETQVKSESSRMLPDMVIRLPGGRNIIVDAKTPIGTYLKATNTNDDSLLADYVKSIKDHAKKLGQKDYWAQFSPTPEFVIMFLPGESFFSTALRKEPDLVEYSLKGKVIIATPITLITLLKTIAFSWQQHSMAENVRQIIDTGRSVCRHLDALATMFKTFSKSWTKTNEEFRKIDNLLQDKLSPAADKLKAYGGQTEERELEN